MESALEALLQSMPVGFRHWSGKSPNGKEILAMINDDQEGSDDKEEEGSDDEEEGSGGRPAYHLAARPAFSAHGTGVGSGTGCFSSFSSPR